MKNDRIDRVLKRLEDIDRAKNDLFRIYNDGRILVPAHAMRLAQVLDESSNRLMRTFALEKVEFTLASVATHAFSKDVLAMYDLTEDLLVEEVDK